jgi:hypothetical protein
VKTPNGANGYGRTSGLWCETVWESFRSDVNLRRVHQISDGEMKSPERVSMMGRVMSKQDYLFILKIIRHEYP